MSILALIKKVASMPGLFAYLDFPTCMWKAIRLCSSEIIVLTACVADYNNTAKKKKEKYIAELSEEERYQLGFEILA